MIGFFGSGRVFLFEERSVIVMEFVFGFFFGRCFWLGGVGFRNVRFLVEGVWFDFRFCRLSGESFYLYIERIIFLVLIGG